MSKIHDQIIAANAAYANNFGDKGTLPGRPRKQFAILTCMDARLDPAKYAGIEEGDAHVIRNAGGRASDDAIRSLVISHTLLGTREWFVIHHTDCGMETVTDQTMRQRLRTSLEPADSGTRRRKSNPGKQESHEGDYINWLTIDDPVQSVAEDVARLRCHPLVPEDIVIHGYLYDVNTGRLVRTPPATA